MNYILGYSKSNVLYPLYINNNITVNLRPNTNDTIIVNNNVTCIINLPNLDEIIGGFRLYISGESNTNITINAYSGNTINNSTQLILNSINGNTTGLIAHIQTLKWHIINQLVGPSNAIATNNLPIIINNIPPIIGQTLVATSPTNASWQNALSNVSIAPPINATDGNGLILSGGNTLQLEYATATQPGILNSIAQTISGLKSLSINDNSLIKNNANNTKTLNFNLTGQSNNVQGVFSTTFTTNKTLTFPNITDTIITKNTSDILTNKTLISNTNNITAKSLFANSGSTTIDISSTGSPNFGQTLIANNNTLATWQNIFADINKTLIIYVNKSGDDSNGNGSLQLPFLTITRALESIESPSSDTPYVILVGPGIYNEHPIVLKIWTFIVGINKLSTTLFIESDKVTLDSKFSDGICKSGFQNISLTGNALYQLDLQSIGGGGTANIYFYNTYLTSELQFMARTSDDILILDDFQIISDLVSNGPVNIKDSNFYNGLFISDDHVHGDTTYNLQNITINKDLIVTQNNNNVFTLNMSSVFIFGSLSITANFTITLTIDTPSFPNNINFSGNINITYKNNCKSVGYSTQVPDNWETVLPSQLENAIDRIASFVVNLSGGHKIPTI